MMLTYSSVMNEESIYFDSTPGWSLQRTTKLLSDESLYSNTEYSDQDISLNYDNTLKIKSESIFDQHPADVSCDGWQDKFIDHWTPQDCLMWLIHELQDLKVTQPLTEIKMELIAHMSGADLKDMSIHTFNEMFPSYGSDLFNRLQKFKVRYSYNSYFSYDQWSSSLLHAEEPFSRFMTSSQEPTTLTDLDSKSHPPPITESSSARLQLTCTAELDTGYKSDSSMDTTVVEPQPVMPEKRRPGRPRGTRKKKKPEKLGRLWEFIRDLLLNPQYNPSMICWENYDEGMFRFVHSDRVAKLWGSKKENEDMNYEKLSRAMRYYYKSQVLLPVYGKRLVYKFGPTATGWRSENPIMRCQG